jgi:hypothetical protein
MRVAAHCVRRPRGVFGAPGGVGPAVGRVLLERPLDGGREVGRDAGRAGDEGGGALGELLDDERAGA